MEGEAVVTTTFTEYREQAHATDQSMWLGLLCFYKVSETSVHHGTLAAELNAVGLAQYVPRPPADSDTFRRVVFNGQRRGHIATPDPDVFENLLVRDVAQGGGRIVKRIVIERVDKNEHPLDFHESVEITFDDTAAANWTAKSNSPRPAPAVSWHNLNGSHTESINLANRLVDEYKAQRGCVDAAAVRRVITRVIDGCHATQVKEGVYFTAPQHTETVEALEAIAQKLPGALVHSLPLIDNDKQRSTVKEAFVAEVTTDANRLIDEIAEITRANSTENVQISARRAETIVAQHQQLQAKLAEYQELLSDNVDEAQFRARVLKSRIVGLLDCVKS